MIKKNSNQKGQMAIILGIIFLILMGLGYATVNGVADTSVNDKILNTDNIQQQLAKYFSSHNLTNFITNTYLNETYLNKTFITNQFYQTDIYNQTYNDYITQVTNNQYLTQVTNFIFANKIPVKIANLDNVSLNNTNCSEIDFYFRDSLLGSIKDNLALNVSTQLSSVQNVNFAHSFFFDGLGNIVNNNIDLINYDSVSNYAIKNNNLNNFELKFNDSLVGSELIFNWAQKDFGNDNDQNIFTIFENGTAKVKFYANNGKIYLKDILGGNTLYTYKLDCKVDDGFCIYKMQISTTDIKLIDSTGYNVITLPISLNPNVNQISIKGDNPNHKETYLRSFYFNKDLIVVNSDQYTLNSDVINYNRGDWKSAEIFLNPSSVFYKIDGQIANIDFPVNNTDYKLDIDLTKTSIANIFCKQQPTI